MVKLIIARHGEFSHIGAKSLTDQGRATVNSLATRISRHATRSKITVISSTIERARVSAVIISDKIKCKVILDKDLYDGHMHGIMKVVESWADKFDILILVMQNEDIKVFPTYFAKQKFGIELMHPTKGICQDWSVGYGNAWIIDCVKKTIAKV